MARTRNSDTARLERRLTIAIGALSKIACGPWHQDSLPVVRLIAGTALENLKVKWKGNENAIRLED